MYDVEKLYMPKSISEALTILNQDKDAWIIAGGTDVMIKMRHKKMKGVRLMSIRQLDVLKGVDKLEDGTITIGPATTFTELSKDPIIENELPMLKTAALAMGGPQIQNMATIGGNVCNGATSADSASSLFALDANLVLESEDDSRIVPIEEFYLGPGRTDIQPGEMLTKIIIPPKKDGAFGCAYIKFATRKAMDIAILGAAATCVLNKEDKRIERATIALGVAGPTPVRCLEAEKLLNGQILTQELLDKVGKAALLPANPRSSWRASKEYRECLIEELSARAFYKAFLEAGGHEL